MVNVKSKIVEATEKKFIRHPSLRSGCRIIWLFCKKNVENRRYLNDILPREYVYKITSFSLIEESLVLCEAKFDATFLINIYLKEMLKEFLVRE